MQKHIIALFLKSAMRYPARTIIAVSGAATTTFIGSFIGPFIIAQLLEGLQYGSLTLSGAWPLIGLYALTQLYGEVIGWRINLYYSWTMQVSAQKDLYRRIFTALTEQSLSFHSDRFGGALVSQTAKLIGAFERFWDTIIFQIVPTLVSIIATTIILSFIFWQYALFLFVLSIVFAITAFFGSRFLAIRNKEEAQANTASNAYVADAVTNIMTIKSYGREDDELNRLTKKVSFWRSKNLASMRGFLAISTVYSSLIAILNTVALAGAIWASEHSFISIGTVYLSITYTFVVARQLWEMNNIMRNYNRILGDAHDMTDILRLKRQIVNNSDHQLAITDSKIVIDTMSFSHDGNPNPLFKNFSLTIEPGERIGLVGHSGSGKTTLTKILLRFMDVDSGAITIDGQDIKDVTQESLRKNIAYVPQEPMLFHRTLRENIAYGKLDATEKEIEKAATLAHAAEFIEKLPKKYETLVGERGVKLSGGQRQRIAIARAILKDAPILVLDEATSALDSESEKLIQDALSKLMKNRTSIVIAHRLSTVQKMDKIIVLDNGKIIEQGSHKELLDKKGTYAKLWAHQSGGFLEE